MAEEDEDQQQEETRPAGPSAEERLAALEARDAARQRTEVLSGVLGDSLGTPVGQMFARAYDGALDPEAVRTAAAAVNLVPEATAADQAGTASPEEQAAHGSLLDLHAGAVAPGMEPGPHPNATAREVAVAVRKHGTEDEALGAYVESHARSILAGDDRARINLFADGGARRGGR